MRFFILFIILSVQFISGAEPGIEILKNGTFKNDSFWNLALNGDASAKDTAYDNILSVIIATPGSDSWFIQLTQNNLCIKKDLFYTLSFDIESSQPRTILTSVCKNGGDYIPYSIRDTLKVDTSFSRYTQHFQMKQPTDSFARVEFNFGIVMGDIKIKNISLIEYIEPKISFSNISPQNIAFIGEPIKLSWTSIELTDTLKLSVSYDNGYSWSIIRSDLKSTDSLEWVPESDHSPWCFFKLATSKVSTISPIMQIIPKIELISNGSFLQSYTNWSLFADSTRVNASMDIQNSILTITSIYRPITAENAVKLSQSPMQLDISKSYECFFTCYARESCVLKVYLSDCVTKKDLSDTADITINNTPTRYHIVFIARKTVTDGTIQFIPDTASTEISFSNISLVNISDLSIPVRYTSVTSRIHSREQFQPVFLSGKSQSRNSIINTSTIFDLSGRKIPVNSIARTHNALRVSGIVIVNTSNSGHNQRTKAE
jgi:hypothetical protein